MRIPNFPPPTSDEIERAIRFMSSMRFFPTDEYARMGIGREIRKFCHSKARLDWLVDEMISKVREWPGIMELRAIYCTRFKPLDEVWVSSELPGFTAADSENRYLERQGQEMAEKIAQYKREAAQLPAQEQQANRKLIEEVNRKLLTGDGLVQ